MANRIEKAILKLDAKLKGMNGTGLNGTPLSEYEKGLDLEVWELAAYQNMKNRAMLERKLSLEEAQTIYRALGEGGNWRSGTSLATKVVVTQVMGELLGVK